MTAVLDLVPFYLTHLAAIATALLILLTGTGAAALLAFGLGAAYWEHRGPATVSILGGFLIYLIYLAVNS